MPQPTGADRRYLPGLDGLRAIAVLAVVAYHAGLGAFPGGLLGVGVFFTLSGYLITDILLSAITSGGAWLRGFWLARARRLLPAMFVMLAVVTAWVTTIGPHQVDDYRGAVVSSSLYYGNWWLIYHKVSYFQGFGEATPINHLWSLSVEEQFYIMWPPVLAAAFWIGRRTGDQQALRRRLAWLAAGLALLSTVAMAVCYTPGRDPSRVYYGTDTRCDALLIGAILALLVPSGRLRPQVTPRALGIIDGVGILGLIVIGLMIVGTDEYSPFLYRGGFLVLSLATAVVVFAVVQPAGRLNGALGVRPLRWIGVRAYGIYLWHFPIATLTAAPGVHGFQPMRAALQFAATLVVAAVSWRVLEDPIRRGAVGRLARELRWRHLRPGALSLRAWAIAVGSSAVALAATAGMAGAGMEPADERVPGRATIARTVTASPGGRPSADRSLCNSVVHVGDSTSEGLMSDNYLPDKRQQISAWYGAAGARTQHFEISGARSIFERVNGQPNAREVADVWRGHRFGGCWVFALGTNEAANVADGSTFTFDQRIDSMMEAAGGRPVLWVNVKTLLADGGYADANMAAWDDALVAACTRYPNMRVYDWRSDVRDEWYISDGIHFTSPGYAARARLIAGALVRGFPAGAPIARAARSSCLVGSAPLTQRSPGTRSDGARPRDAPSVDGPALLSRTGRVGDLAVGRSHLPAVLDRYGRPTTRAPYRLVGWSRTGTRVAYRCGLLCLTEFYFDADGALQKFVTSDRRRFRTKAGTRVGDSAARAEALEEKRPTARCPALITKRGAAMLNLRVGETVVSISVSGAARRLC